MSRLFTSESVTEGHPDKVADAVSDAVLDALLSADVASRVAVETLVTTGTVVVAGEVSTTAYADISSIARERILKIGYDKAEASFDGKSCGVLVSLGSQSPDIAQGVDAAEEVRDGVAGDDLDRQGAGDQGLMFGYACLDTPTLMPLPIDIAHRLSERLAQVRKSGELPWVLPDGKTQVTIEYDGATPVRVDTVVVSTQHTDEVKYATLKKELIEQVIMPAIALGFAQSALLARLTRASLLQQEPKVIQQIIIRRGMATLPSRSAVPADVGPEQHISCVAQSGGDVSVAPGVFAEAVYEHNYGPDVVIVWPPLARKYPQSVMGLPGQFCLPHTIPPVREPLEPTDA